MIVVADHLRFYRKFWALFFWRMSQNLISGEPLQYEMPQDRISGEPLQYEMPQVMISGEPLQYEMPLVQITVAKEALTDTANRLV